MGKLRNLCCAAALVAVKLDLPRSRAQIFSRARSASVRFFMFSAAKASERGETTGTGNEKRGSLRKSTVKRKLSYLSTADMVTRPWSRPIKNLTHFFRGESGKKGVMCGVTIFGGEDAILTTVIEAKSPLYFSVTFQPQ